MKVILIGGGGNMKSIVASNFHNTKLTFEGYTDIENKGEILGTKYLGFENDLDLKNKNVAITISYLQTARNRDLRFALIESFSTLLFDFILFLLISIEPAVGLSINDNKLSNVDFPDPEGPIIE